MNGEEKKYIYRPVELEMGMGVRVVILLASNGLAR